MRNSKIRFVKEEDAKEIVKIYEPYVTKTSITFEYQVPSEEEFRERIKQTLIEYPYLVYVIDEKIIGYAYAHRYQLRAAYQWNAELSIYIDNSYLGGGIGTALYQALMDILTLQNVINVYGIVTSPNLNSEKLHKRLGFQKLGIYHSTGYKFGIWHDVDLFEKKIAEYTVNPEPVIPITKVDQNKIADILNKYSN